MRRRVGATGRAAAAALLAWTCAGCDGGGATPDARHADEVIEAPGVVVEAYGDPARAVNGVRGGGATAGGRDVYSLGRDEDDGVLVLRWAG
ncbi:MAG: hypothetical protein ACQEXJ_22095, partial [Myxococcota bacterium]